MEQFRGLLEGRLGGNPPPRGAVAAAARETGLRDGLISRYLSGAIKPSPRSLKRLAPWLGVPYLMLLQIVNGEDGMDGRPVRATQPPPDGGTDGHVSIVPQSAIEAILEASVALQRAVSLLDHNPHLTTPHSTDYIYQAVPAEQATIIPFPSHFVDDSLTRAA